MVGDHGVHERGGVLAEGAAVAATLATPDPAVARYVLAFAGLVLAFEGLDDDHVPAAAWA